MSATTGAELDGIAIVAAAGRFPAAPSLEQFWANLCGGVEGVRHFSGEELEQSEIPASTRSSPRFVPAGALLDDFDKFDAALFGFTPREAEVLDPQHRLFFECSWEALERAGYAPGTIALPVGVFAGTSFAGYLLHNLIPQGDAIRDVGVYQTYITNDKDSLTTYVAYKLNLRGPCVTLQTACSTSLVAVQFACQSLLNFQCDMALAGGVTVQVPHVPGYLHEDGGIMSPDGRCRPFDARASGTVPGSGVGVVVLKRLADAVAAGDEIMAVIRGAAVNNDGANKVGFTAPGADGQAEAIAIAQALAGVSPDTIGFVEAHGTGTALGDPIEVAALTRVFRRQTARRQYCALGALKSNIGHVDAAAGVAGLIKAALAVQHGMIPATLHFEHPNPNIPLTESPFFVPTKTIPWPIDGGPRRAAVSSFGIGGTNAHVVLEQAPQRTPSGASRPAQILSVSARSAASLQRLAENVADRLTSADAPPLADAAFTLHVGRREWPHRASVAATSAVDAAAQLRQAGHAAHSQPPVTGESRVAFLFPGQGVQQVGMAAGLYEQEAVFRQEVDACCERLRPLLGCDLRDLLLAPEDPERAQRLNQTALAQPALVLFEYALARLWMSWGVVPSALIGHSLGEYTAACLSGVISRDAALSLVAARAGLMQSVPAGAMIAVFATPEQLREMGGDRVALAVINAPESLVASGPNDAIDRLIDELTARGMAYRRIHIAHPYHSPMVEPILEAFRREVAAVTLGPPAIPYISNVTGDWISATETTNPDYWVSHLRQTVQFDRGLKTLLGGTPIVPIEIGPGQSLTPLARAVLGADATVEPIASMPRRDDPIPRPEWLASALGRAWARGVRVDWTLYYQEQRRRRVSVPATPFERVRYWIDPPLAIDVPAGPSVDRLLSVVGWTPSPAPDSDEGAAPIVVVVGSDVQARRLAQHFEGSGTPAIVLGTDVPAEIERSLPAVLGNGQVSHSQRLVVCALPALNDRPDVLDRKTARETAIDVPLAIARALSSWEGAGAEVLLVANRLYADVVAEVSGAVSLPWRALLGGPALVIPQEYPHLRCRVVDVDSAVPSQDTGWMGELAAEAASPCNESFVAYRGGVRYVRDVQSIPADARRSFLQRGGAYWITGATGAMGQVLARHLAATCDAKLLLTSRGPIDEDTLGALRAAGGDPIAVSADAADADAMQRAADVALARFGRIDGVIHTAGVGSGGLIALRGTEAIDAVLRPKVAGTVVVADLAQRCGARFVMLFSSLATLQGGLGHVDYVAGNAFLDSFAHWHTHARGIFTVSISWDAWRDIGMAVAAEAAWRERVAGPSADTLAPQIKGLSTEEGVAVFERVLRGTAKHIAVSQAPLRERMQRHRDAMAVMTAMAVHLGERPVRDDNLHGLSVEAQIAALWERVLGIPNISSDASFFEVGGDSLKGLQLVLHVNEHFGLTLPIARFFGAPTIASLSKVVRESTAEMALPSGADAVLDASSERGRLRTARRARREAV